MKKRVFSFSAMCLALTMSLTAADYGLPSAIQDGNILHCFDWTFNDIKTELPNIAAAGFGAVQVSPVQGNCATNAEWFYAYMPYDFKFRANGNGSREQLKSLCAEAETYGIKIIVDVVANHVNQASGYHDRWWDSNGRVRWQGGINYGDRNSITHGQLGGYGDVNSEDAEVQARAKAFVEDLKSLGVKGIRWDAAKHIGLPSEGCRFWSTVTSVPGMWHYGEILDNPGGNGDALMKEYTQYMSVTDNGYSNQCRNNDGVPGSHAGWAAGTIDDSKVVYWAESHDDYSNEWQASTHVSQAQIDRAWAIVACRQGASALYFSRPAANTRTTIKMGQKGSTQFKQPQIAEVNKFRNLMQGHADYFSQGNGAASVTRKDGGAVIVKRGGGGNVSVANGGGYCPAGTYRDKVSGGTFTVTATTISGTVGASGIAVIYKDGVTPDPTPDPDPDPTPDPDPVPGTLTITGDYNVAYSGTKTNIYYWGGSSKPEWPGIPMQTVTGSDGRSYKVAKVTEGTTSVIFNTNGDADKTADLDYTAGFVMNDNGATTTAVIFKHGDTPGPQPQPGNYNVFFNNATTNWATPYIHYWGSTESTWPGAPMTRVRDNVWGYKVPEGTTGVIFNAGDGDASKTDDFVYVLNHIYSKAGGDEGLYQTTGVDDIEAADTDAPIVFYNLQGIEMPASELAPGLYIRRQGRTVSKVYIR